VSVNSVEDAKAAGDRLLAMGVGTALITLGAKGVLLQSAKQSMHIPGFKVKVVETTGAGDAFNGGFAVALGEGRDPVEAVRFGCATAALSVTKPGTAPSMPMRAEVDQMLAGS
jgi:ribokinase